MDLRKYIPPDQAVFPALLDQITDVCLAIDGEGRVRFANRACERLIGCPIAEIAGTPLETLVHREDWPAVAGMIDEMRRRPDQVAPLTFRFPVGETVRILESTWSSVPLPAGESLLLLSGNDATERVHAQMQLRAREEELGRAERVARLATWERNLTTNQFTASRQLLEIYGVARDTDLAFKDLARFVPSDDLAFVRESMQRAQEALGSIAIDHRIIRADGQERILHLRGQAEWSGSGFVMYGTAQDVTEMRLMERALRASEQRFRAIFDSMFQFIGLMKPDGTLIEANETALAFGGLRREDVVGKPFWDCYWWSVGAAQQERLQEAIRLAAGGRFVRYNTEIYGAGERLTIIDFSIKPILNADGQVELLIPEGRDISERIRHEEQINESNRRLRELAAQLHNAQEEERARIAREVHDVLGQAITSLRLDVVWIVNQYPSPDPVFRLRTNSTLALVEETIADVRRISQELRPGVLDHFGLPAAIEWLCEQHEQRTDIAFTTIDETGPRLEELDPKLAIALFRIFQEALTNIIKHAGASSVRTHLSNEDNTLCLAVADDGRGIRPEDIEQSNSLGLLTMRERIFPWNGTITITGEPDQGTCITVRVPHPQPIRRTP